MSGDAAFTIHVDPPRNLVCIAMSGFFTPEDVDRFCDAQRAAHAKLRCGPNEHLTINDLRAMKIQPQDTVRAFRNLLADPAARSRRLAFIVSDTLARMQLMRALESRDARCFTDAVEAEGWVLGSAERHAA